MLNSKFELDIDEENISLMLGSNSHIVLYPINKKNLTWFVLLGVKNMNLIMSNS